METYRPDDFAVLQVLPKLETGGVERVVVELTEAVARTGARALVASAPGRLVSAVERAGGMHIPLALDSRNPLKLAWNADLLARLIRKHGVSLIHAHSRAPAFSARAAARRQNIPFVTTYHGAYGETLPFKRRYNAVMASGDRVIAVSKFVGEMVRARHHTGPDRLRVVPGGVNTALFNPDAVSDERMIAVARGWHLPDGAPTIMLPARLTGWKGQRIFIEALARMQRQDAVGILLGSAQGRDAYLRELRELAQRHGVATRLFFAGDCADMPAALKLADIVVNASTEPEAFGRTIVEAQSMRRLTIATDHGAARDTIIDSETGWRTPPGNAEALAATLDNALNLPMTAKLAIGAVARRHVAAHYSVAAMQTGNLAIYGELLG